MSIIVYVDVGKARLLNKIEQTRLLFEQTRTLISILNLPPFDGAEGMLGRLLAELTWSL
ncbi:hypothetical protein HanRHA438_Chr06g0258171 [Helianthus annuus]|uniref:Uncharacterized protein n=1 Tax=Helianthus annuus TaxID=4232 RepID=A0A251UI72_HELAN|nr:hypothetical protein HanXRQr2_Chr06g0248931 [Helianthus annuus]KAJ0559811.1 hypothetical protein HanHA300_Chr06g0204521 [Helianthus annuus]KAJ0572789.1 hypothetical protein HanHA89_Chr06g0219581 [Helianthus annuus]KAJ0737223.1 hypothetical protein HanLR1_Chr06g0204571 [Helianthus annuus]KAJ0910976.1 hypothetical protein HanRHA438_Chr06g0258171 [Helianthus annuus]